MQPDQAAVLAEMALDLAAQPDIEQTLEHIMVNARRAVACDAVGILLLKGGELSTVTSSEPAVRRCDELQIATGEGPFLKPSDETESALITDTRIDERWPAWSGQVAGELGILSVLSVRLTSRTTTLGALNLYAEAAGAFTLDDLALASIFGRHAAIALVKRQEAESLREAVATRHLIGQAQGILMERYSIDAERAFSAMRRHSQDNNLLIRRVAEQIVANRRLPATGRPRADDRTQVVGND